MKYFQLFFLLIAINFMVFAQAPDTMWTKTFGGIGDDIGSSVQQTTDGGYIIAATTESFGAGSLNLWLIRTNSNGDTLWTKSFDEGRGFIEPDVQQTIDGGYVVVGTTNPLGPDSNDVRIIKTNSDGVTLWIKTFGGSGNDIGYSVQQTSDGGYIIIANTDSFGEEEAWLIKTNLNGDTLWTKTISESVGFSVQQTLDDGYIITGINNSQNGNVWLYKTDTNGNALWSKTFGGSGTDYGLCVQQTSDGGYILTGVFDYLEALLLKTDANGNTLWTKTFYSGFSSWGFSVIQTSDDGYVFVGQTQSVFPNPNETNILIIKTDSNGNSLWSNDLRGNGDDFGRSVQQTSDGGYIIIGSIYSSTSSSQDVWQIKIAPDITAIDEIIQPLIKGYQLSQNYPNPFNPSTKINFSIPEMSFVTLKVYDVLGNEVATLLNEDKPAGSYEVEFDASELTSGIYFYKLKAGNFIETKKMILLR